MELGHFTAARGRQISESCNSESELQDTPECTMTECTKTNWRLISAAGGVGFLCALESTATGMSEWPYMSTIDPDATAQFYGMTSSVYTVGHAIFAVISFNFGSCFCVYWMSGLFMCCVIPTNRRYIMMGCYFVFGIGTSTSSVLKMYTIEISSNEDRARALAVVTVSELLAVIIGPVIQLCFSGISYPGIEIFYKMRLHIFSAPTWVATCINVVYIAFITVFMKPVKRNKTKTKNDTNRLINIVSLQKTFEELRKSDACWTLVFLCFTMSFLQIPTDGLWTIISPYLMIAFDWGREKTVVYSSIAMGIVGIISFGAAAIMMTPTFGRIPQRWIYLSSLCLPLFLYILSFPYSATSHPIPAFNDTSGSGCNSVEYSWCEGAQATTPYLFLPLLIVVLSLVIPLCSISLETVYSKLFGSMDQTVMQGAMVAIGDVVGILAPIYSTLVFTYWGLETLYIVNGMLTTLTSIVWIAGFAKLKEYD